MIKLESDIHVLDKNQFYQIRVLSAAGVPIFHWVDFDDRLSSPIQTGHDIVTLKLDHIWLYPGRYFVNVICCDRYGTAFDSIENAVFFDVEAGAMISMSRQFFPSLGLIHLVPQWQRLSAEDCGPSK